MALVTIDLQVRDKLGCGPCADVILVLDDGTTTQELTGIILYEYPGLPGPGWWTYTIQYDG